MKTHTRILAGFLIYVCLFISGCKLNLYSQFTSGTGTEEILERVYEYLDEQNFDDAIATINAIYAGNETNSEIAQARASAYAGRGGFLYLTHMPEYITNFYDGTTVPPTVTSKMIMSANAYDAATTTKADDLATAFATLVAINSTASNRSKAVNMFLSFVSVAMIHLEAKLANDANNDEVLDNSNMCNAVLTAQGADRIMNGIIGFFESMDETDTGNNEPFRTVLLIPLDPMYQLGGGAGTGSSATTTSTWCQTNNASNECKDTRSILDGRALTTTGDANAASNPFQIRGVGGAGC